MSRGIVTRCLATSFHVLTVSSGGCRHWTDAGGGGLPLEVDRYHCSGERVRTGELVFDVPVGMLESVERSTFTLARLAERMAVGLHVGVVLEQNIDPLAPV